MELTPRRRAFIALVVILPLAWVYVEIGWRLVFNLLEVLHYGNVGYFSCGGGVSGLVSTFNGCSGSQYHWDYAVVELLLMTVVVGAVVWGLSRWVTWPIRSMTRAVEQLGPTNLGLRMRHDGPPKDETRQLGDAIDRMLDRVADGYEAQRRFASNASHELRTPLATQRALIEVSLASALTPDQLELLSRQLLATNERNEKLVEGLLVLAETERGLVSSSPQRLDAVVGETVDLLTASALDRDVKVTTELTAVEVIGEAPLLERLVTNLVSNAIKYNSASGWVRVEVGDPGRLVVANSGPVVPAQDVAGLFEPFRRMSGERLDHGGGVGLGLTIARSIVAAHSGRIEARANPDGGLTIEVRLPVATR